jgi:hypothetical protein
MMLRDRALFSVLLHGLIPHAWWQIF